MRVSAPRSPSFFPFALPTLACEGPPVCGDGTSVPLTTSHGTYWCCGFSAFVRAALACAQGGE